MSTELIRWTPIALPAYVFRVGDTVQATPLHAAHKPSEAIGTVVAVLPPEGAATLGTVVVRYPDKEIDTGKEKFVFPCLTWHNAGNLIKAG